MLQKNSNFTSTLQPSPPNSPPSKLYYSITSSFPLSSLITPLNKTVSTNIQQSQKHSNILSKTKSNNNLIQRSLDNVNHIKYLSKLKLEKIKSNKNGKFNTHGNNILIQQVKINSLYRVGHFCQVYDAVLSHNNNQQVIVKKICINHDYKSRQQYFAKILKSPYIVKFIGTYHSKQPSPNLQLSQNQQNSPPSTSQKQQPVQHLNIIMQKYGNNLHQILQIQAISSQNLKLYLYQMFRAIVYIHSLNICHRDIKTNNFVVKNNRIFLCDFGAAKMLSTSSKSVSYIFSREYRAPQLLFGCQNYDTKVDIWAMGCVAAQMVLRRPLFNGQNNLDQLIKILTILGSPKWQIISFCKKKAPQIPKINGSGLRQVLKNTCDTLLINLLQKMLRIQPKQRPQSLQILSDPYFDQLREQQYYRAHLRQTTFPNLYYFTKNQLKYNQLIENKLVPFWIKQHCKRFDVDLQNYIF